MTPKQAQELSDEELRIKVAELCGWTHRRPHEEGFMVRAQTHGFKVSGNKGTSDLMHVPGDRYSDLERIPNYPQDLNAMHEVESLVPASRRAGYLTLISVATFTDSRHVNEGMWDIASAAARQRAESFVIIMGMKR